jgi:hypothetical protein
MCPKYTYKEVVCTRAATPIHQRTPNSKICGEEKTYEVYGNPLQKILWFMTVNFRHRSSKFRHKTASMTKFEKVIY